VNGINDEGVIALLGLALMTIEGHEIVVPPEVLEAGLPANSGVQVYKDELTDELVIKIQSYGGDEPAKDEDDPTGGVAE
jgi:hypothetical protein